MVHLGIRRGIVRSIGMALVLTSSSSWLLPVGAQSRPRVERLDSGTVIPVRLNNELSSKYSRRGDKFTATLRSETEQEGPRKTMVHVSSAIMLHRHSRNDHMHYRHVEVGHGMVGDKYLPESTLGKSFDEHRQHFIKTPHIHPTIYPSSSQ